jgi:amidase
MTRTVTDAAMLLNALAGVDDRDPAGPAARGHIPQDYTTFLKVDALKGRRLGVRSLVRDGAEGASAALRNAFAGGCSLGHATGQERTTCGLTQGDR